VENFEAVLGRVIAAERKRVGLTQEALAYRCKLHPTYVSQLERGLKSPTVRVLIVIAEAVGFYASDVLRRAEDLSGRATPNDLSGRTTK
jgi:transcriptional regulator with XRE-family HTH domain